MLNEALPIILLVVNVGVALYVLKNARAMFSNKPDWLNDVFDDADGWVEEKIKVMLTPDPESGMNFIDMLAERFGKGFRMSLLAQKSGEARHMKMIEGRVFDALKDKSPELKIGLQALDQFGLGDLATPENLPALMQIAQKYGLFDQFLGKTAQQGSNPGSRSTGNPFKVT